MNLNRTVQQLILTGSLFLFAFALHATQTATLIMDVGSGRGTFSPNYNGKKLTVGKSYTTRAVPAAGCTFSNWSVTLSNNVTTSNAAKLTFPMAEGLQLTAYFNDTQAPTVKITTKAATTSNAVYAITGTAKDNVGVVAVWCSVNGGGLIRAATGDAYTNWTAAVLLGPDENTVQVYAEDAAGHQSTVASVTLNNVATGFAPETLAGTTVQLNASSNQGAALSFDRSTYSQVGTGGGVDSDVGTYTYSLTDGNTAVLTKFAELPPDEGTNASIFTFDFTSGTNGLWTNQDGLTGTFSIRAASSLAPSMLSGLSLQGTGAGTNLFQFTNDYGDGTFTTVSTTGNSSGAYTYQPFSPAAGMIVASVTNGSDDGSTNYILMEFSENSLSNMYVVLSVSTNGLDTNNGTFTVTGKANASYTGPVSLAGMQGAVTEIKTNGKRKSFLISFGASSYGEFTTDTNEGSDVGIFSLTRTGPKTGIYSSIPLAPPDAAGNGGTQVSFNFTTSKSASFSDPDSHGTITFSEPNPTVPATLVGKTLFGHNGHNRNGSGSISFGYATFHGSSSGDGVGTYTYAAYGPQLAIVTRNFTDADDAGVIEDIILWFSTATSGSYYQDKNDGSTSTGTFTMK